MSDIGWISIHRKLGKHWIWEGKPFSYGQAWIDILLECNHSKHKILIKKSLVTATRGQSLNSLKTWATRWGWSVRNVRTFFKLLIKDKMIDTQSVGVTTRLTVCNYSEYQDKRHASDTQPVPQVTRTRHASDTQVTTNNNDNNGNNDNNVNKSKRFTPPSLDEIIALFIEKQSTKIEAEKFFYFYESKNWMVGKNKMKSWKASVGGWIARNKSEEIKEVGYRSTLV